MSFYFGLMFDNVVHVGESANQEIFDQIVQVGHGDVTIGLSFPRYSRRTVRAINFAHERGSKVIAITDSASNSMPRRRTMCCWPRATWPPLWTPWWLP